MDAISRAQVFDFVCLIRLTNTSSACAIPTMTALDRNRRHLRLVDTIIEKAEIRIGQVANSESQQAEENGTKKSIGDVYSRL